MTEPINDADYAELERSAKPRWRDTARGIVIESKDDIRKRLGRSTDTGDALVMAAWGRILRRRMVLRPAVVRPADGANASIMGDILHEDL